MPVVPRSSLMVSLPALVAATALAALSCQREAPPPPRTGSPEFAAMAPQEQGADGPVTVAESGNRQMKDTGITARVKAALLADPKVKGLSIHVETHDAAVTLKGEVDADQQVSHAVDVVRGVTGVREVVNRLSVKGENRAERSNTG